MESYLNKTQQIFVDILNAFLRSADDSHNHFVSDILVGIVLSLSLYQIISSKIKSNSTDKWLNYTSIGLWYHREVLSDWPENALNTERNAFLRLH